jgi:ABC-type multidrug transport system fused ATPase/permease subunit
MTVSRLETPRRYWRLLSHYLRPEWARVALIGVTLAVSIGGQVAAPLVTSRFIDRAIDGAALNDLLLLAALAVVLALIGQGAAVAETWLAERVSWSATNALRIDLVAHLLRLDASFHAARTPGELIERVDGDVATLARFFSRFVVYVLGNLVLILVILGLLFGVDWRVGLAMSGFVGLGLVAMVRIRAGAVPAWVAARQGSAEFYGFLGEYLSGLEDVRSSGARAFVLRRCAEVMRAWQRVYLRAEMWGYVIIATSLGLFALGTAVAFGLGAMLYRDGTLSIGAVYLIFQFTTVLQRPTEQLRTEVQDLQQADASMGRIEELLATAPRLVDGPGDALPLGVLSIELEHVTFGYTPDAPVLHDLSLRVEPGRVLGVVGRTGSGKTSIARLIPRFYDPIDGVVRLGGVDVREVRLGAVRGRIGIVTQDIHLFDASLRDNLTLFDDTIPDGRLNEVLRSVGFSEWLATLPHGLDSPLGAGGIGLSAGQAQVLACARVLLREPDIVILDEASSRLDPATERLVHVALGKLLFGRTGIIIAHRLETIAYADDVLVLEDGRVREHGPRAELAADQTSRFAELLRIASEHEEVLA